MLTEIQKEKFASMRVEIIDLNVAAHFFINKINRFVFIWHNTTRKYLLEELIALRYIENGMILHLTNLDDDSSKYSFNKVAKEINKSIKDQNELKILNSKLKSFKRNINNLKVKHRNIRISHLNYETDLDFDEFMHFQTELRPLIIQANEIADLMWGEKIQIYFTLGSLEGNLDFRKNTDQLQIDINKNKSFS